MSDGKALTKGQQNKKLHWCTVTVRRVTLATFKDVAAEHNISVADLLDRLATQLKNGELK